NARETFKYDDRPRFLRQALTIAGSRPVIFKLHPAEQHERAIREIRSIVPDAAILTDGNTEHMIANCEAVVAQHSTVAFTGASLGKEGHSYIDPDHVRQVLPLQNGGSAARNTAEVCRACFESNPVRVPEIRSRIEPRSTQPLSTARLHMIPHGGLGDLLYPLVSGIRHAVRSRRRSDEAVSSGEFVNEPDRRSSAVMENQ